MRHGEPKARSPGMSFAELRETEAPPEIAALYAALRTATGVPLVNLIWRHLATMPGVLPWAWGAVRGTLESGAVAAARARLAQAAPLPAGIGRITAGAQGSVVGAVVASYNRGNLTNLLVLTALKRALTQAPPLAAPAVRATLPPDDAPLPAVPPLPALAALAEPTRALVQGLAARHPGAASGGVVPSLYLHLAHWPAVLAALPEALAPLYADLDGARAAVLEAALPEADALRPMLVLGDGVPGGHAPAVLDAVERFTARVIPDMVPIGLALKRALG